MFRISVIIAILLGYSAGQVQAQQSYPASLYNNGKVKNTLFSQPAPLLQGSNNILNQYKKDSMQISRAAAMGNSTNMAYGASGQKPDINGMTPNLTHTTGSNDNSNTIPSGNNALLNSNSLLFPTQPALSHNTLLGGGLPSYQYPGTGSYTKQQ